MTIESAKDLFDHALKNSNPSVVIINKSDTYLNRSHK